MSAAIAVTVALWFTRNLDRDHDPDRTFRMFLKGEWR